MLSYATYKSYGLWFGPIKKDMDMVMVNPHLSLSLSLCPVSFICYLLDLGPTNVAC